MKIRRKLRILDVPVEVLMVVFSFLEPYSLFKNGISRVCKDFNLILNSTAFWNSNKPDDFVMEFVPEDDQYLVSSFNWLSVPANIHMSTFVNPVISSCRKRKYSSLRIRNNTILGGFNEDILTVLANSLSSSLKGLYLVNIGADVRFKTVDLLFRRLKRLKCFCLQDWVVPDDEVKTLFSSIPALEFVELTLMSANNGKSFKDRDCKTRFERLSSFLSSMIEASKVSLKAIYITDRSEFRNDLKKFAKNHPNVHHYEGFSPEELDFYGMSQHSTEEEEQEHLNEEEKNEVRYDTVNSETFHDRKSFLRSLRLNSEQVENLHVSYDDKSMTRQEIDEEFSFVFSGDKKMTRLKRLSFEKNNMFGMNEIMKIIDSSSNNIIQLSIESFRHANNFYHHHHQRRQQQQPNLKIFEVSRFFPLRISRDLPILLSTFRSLREMNLSLREEPNLFQKIVTTFSCSRRLEVLKIGIKSSFETIRMRNFEVEEDYSVFEEEAEEYEVTREMGISGLQNLQIYVSTHHIFDTFVSDENLLNLITLYPNLNTFRVIVKEGQKYGYMKRKLFPKRQYQEMMRRHIKRILAFDPNTFIAFDRKIEVDMRPHLRTQGRNHTILSPEEKKEVVKVLEEMHFKTNKYTKLMHIKSPVVILLVLKYIHMRLTQNIFD